MIFNFDGIVDALEKKLSLLSQWRETLYFSVYRRLIDTVAYIVDKLVFVAEQLYVQSIFVMATQRDAITAHSKMLSYIPYRKKGATGYILMTGDSTGFFNNYAYDRETIVLKKWDEFQDTDKTVNVYLSEDVTYVINTPIISQSLVGSAIDMGSNVVSITLADATLYDINDEIYIMDTYYYNGFYTIINKVGNALYIKTIFQDETFTSNKKVILGLTKLPIVEGKPKSFIYEAKGESKETISIYNDAIDNDNIEVYLTDISGNEISQFEICGTGKAIESLYFVEDDLDNYYCEINNSDDYSYIKIVCGDGFTSRKLVAGEFVKIKYATTLGDTGNIQNKNVLNTFKGTLLDGIGGEAEIYFTNVEAVTGGSDIETLDSIKNNAPNLFFAGYRCGGYQDWVTILSEHPKIDKAVIWSTDDEADDTITIDQNKVFVSAVSSDGGPLSSIDEVDITLNYLKNLKSPTEVVTWRSLNVLYVRAFIDAKISGETKPNVIESTNNLILNKYGILNTEFKTNIYESDFYGLLTENSNIVRHVSELYCLEKDLKATELNKVLMVSKTTVEEDNPEKQIYLVPDTIQIYVKFTGQEKQLVAIDDGGSLVSANGYTLLDTSINYTENSISYIVSELTAEPLDSYEMFLSYKTMDGNNEQQNSIRIGQFDIITDIDTDWIEYDLTYEV